MSLRQAKQLFALQVAIILLTGISLAGWKLNRPLRESIMVISGLAVVLETHTVCGLGSSAVLDAALIQDVIINEVIQSGLLSMGSQLLARNEQHIESGEQCLCPTANSLSQLKPMHTRVRGESMQAPTQLLCYLLESMPVCMHSWLVQHQVS